MLESRKSYGYGYVGTNRKGFEYKILFTDKYAKENLERCSSRMGEQWVNRYMNTTISGYVYPTAKKAIAEGEKWLKATGRSGIVSAVPAEGVRFEY